MTEIRTIRDDEAETFLRLLCDVFDLDFERAKTVFRREPFFNVKCKWAAFEDGRMAACLTTVPIRFGELDGIGIAGVATLPDFRRRGLAESLINAAAPKPTPALLFATDERLYRRIGFQSVDEVISCPLPTTPERTAEPAAEPFVREQYQQWASKDPRRLARDAKRWEYWGFTMKSPIGIRGGYAVLEKERVRELLPEFQPVPAQTPVEWLGLRSMAEHLQIPVENEQVTMTLMARSLGFLPQMFLTDQF